MTAAASEHPAVVKQARGVKRTLLSVLTPLVLTALVAAAAPARAHAADCDLRADLDYNGACGPEFELPAWGDGGGWTDPSKYTTIQLADLTGSGADELFARNDDGIEIWWFDTCTGQWRPAIGADGLPEVLTDFRSPMPTEIGAELPGGDANWTEPQYYTTIQAVDLNGPGNGADIIARFPSGMRVYHYTPPAQKTGPCTSAKASNINGGTWKLVSKDGPFSDKDGYTYPSLYLSIHADPGNGTPAQPPRLFAQSDHGPVVYFWGRKSGWAQGSPDPPGTHSDSPAVYENFTSARLNSPTDGLVPADVTYTNGGVVALYKPNDAPNGQLNWTVLGTRPNPGPFQSVTACGQDCFDSSPSFYETLRFANIDGKPGEDMLGRGENGLQTWQLSTETTKDPDTGTEKEIPAWKPLATLSDLKGTPQELQDRPAIWSSIRTGDVLGNGREQVLALDGSVLQAWSYDPNTDAWSKLPAAASLNLGGEIWTKCGTPADSCPNASYYSTIRVGDVTGDGHAAVIARGPFGIRTWFYCASGDARTEPCNNLDGKAGWTSWLPQDTHSYPQFNPAEPEQIYWSGSQGIGSAHADGTGVNHSFITGAPSCGVAVDGQHVYWAHGAIRRANIDGTGVDQSFIPDALATCGVAVDGQHIYWPTSAETIARANIDGTDVNQSFITGAGDAFDVAVEGQHIYWSNVEQGTIARANIDGTDVNHSFITVAGHPYGLAVDGQHIYWSRLDGTIGRANIDGTDVNQSFITGAYDASGLAVDGQHIYWSNFYGGTIGRANIDGTDVNQSFITGADGTEDVVVRVPDPHSGQAAAYTKLNALALAHELLPAGEKTVREMWTGENAPTDAALDRLGIGILAFAGCPQTETAPYTKCTPPADSSGFTEADWTTVVNQVLHEIELVKNANGFFDTANKVSQKLFISQGANLDAIISDLGVAGAAGNEAEIKGRETMVTIMRILGAVIGAVPGGEPIAAGLEIGPELASMTASTSPTLNSDFSAKYAELKDKFATMVDEVNKGLEVQSQEVRSNYRLLSLLSQLTTGSGPWANPDIIGLESASDEGFAISTYQQLLPTMFARYKITDCRPAFDLECAVSGVGPETIGDETNFTTLGPPPAGGFPDKPCSNVPGGNIPLTTCIFVQLHDVDKKLADKIWGKPPADTCHYQPGDASTKWTYSCDLGILKEGSVSLETGAANGWDFTDYCGHPVVAPTIDPGKFRCEAPSSRLMVGVRGRVVLRGMLTVPPGFHVTSATIEPNQLLHETVGPDSEPMEPVDVATDRPLGTVHLTAGGRPGAFSSAARATASLALTPAPAGQETYDLELSDVNVRVPDACKALPASDTMATQSFELTSTLQLDDGSRTATVPLEGLWRCVRDGAGAVSELRPVPQVPVTKRPGLALSLSGPRTVAPGATVTYEVQVHNQRRQPTNRLISSLWNVAVQGLATTGKSTAATATWHLPELPRGRSQTLRFSVHIPGSAKDRVCVDSDAEADSAQPARAQLCAHVV